MNEILDYIPYGRENAISRESLARITGMSDRQVRKAIEGLREDGEVILSSSHSKGYWRSDDEADISAYIAENRHRIARLHRTNKEIIRKHYERTGQRYTTVREHDRRIV